MNLKFESQKFDKNVHLDFCKQWVWTSFENFKFFNRDY